MWVFTPTSFVSLVEDTNDMTRLIARARFPGDLERMFPAQADKVMVTPWADYRYRVFVARHVAAEAVAAAARAVTYPNFKDAAKAAGADDVRLGALGRVWSALYDGQARAHGDPLAGFGGPVFTDYADAGDLDTRDLDLSTPEDDRAPGCAFCGDQPDLCDCGYLDDAS